MAVAQTLELHQPRCARPKPAPTKNVIVPDNVTGQSFVDYCVAKDREPFYCTWMFPVRISSLACRGIAYVLARWDDICACFVLTDGFQTTISQISCDDYRMDE